MAANPHLEDDEDRPRATDRDSQWQNIRRMRIKKLNREEVEQIEAELDEAKARTTDYLGTVDRDDPDYEKKIGELKKKHKLRIRGRLGKDNPNAPLYRQGGKHYRSSSLDVKPEHSKRVDVYTRGERKMKNEEVELISIEESAYIEEMVGQGKLPEILKYHSTARDHHKKMMGHHSDLAYQSQKIGDAEGFDYHVSKANDHEYQMMHHDDRVDHASGLAAKAKARQEIKDAEANIRSAKRRKNWDR
jgi:hypothetical protein